jgi:phosphoribosylaminoimidazolecarboxamide formyltransferase/IMP cyclohydrolase
VQYGEVAAALRAGRGQLAEPLARRLATEAFQLTSVYDGAIHAFLGRDGAAGSAADLPDTASVTVQRQQTLRYGENPHQRGGWYVPADAAPWGLGTLRQLQGKELSYNNLLDLDAAVRCLRDFKEPACAIVKHHGPCGIAVGRRPADAYEGAHACDPESAFGGIVGLNRPLDDAALAKRLTETFLEVIVAPAVSDATAKALSAKKSLRVMTLDWPDPMAGGMQGRQLLGSWLLQDPDQGAAPKFQVVTTRQPTAAEREDLLFAWTVCGHLLSNGIAVVKGRATVGLGQGQPSRVGSVRLAVRHAGDRARQAVAASDGFFPFPDNIELLAQAGITAVIQPGGSIKDAEVIAAADRAGMAMVMTGVRHFRH